MTWKKLMRLLCLLAGHDRLPYREEWRRGDALMVIAGWSCGRCDLCQVDADMTYRILRNDEETT